MQPTTANDGIGGMVPRENMAPGARKMRDIYTIMPRAPIYQMEFGYYSLDKWKAEQGMPADMPLEQLFGFDPPGMTALGGLGWCEAAFDPPFEVKIIEPRGEECELAQDAAGRHVLYFKGRRSGFMPEYVAHPVRDMKSWEENCKWRLDPSTPSRYADLPKRIGGVVAQAKQGLIVSQRVIGGYMYLRSLIGPTNLLYMVHDDPALIHDCMKTWLDLAEAVTGRHQEHVSFDELFFGEDICFNHGPLISPDMIREFLFPYYRQLIATIKSRQIDRQRHLYFHVDTDGWAGPVIPLYMELGMNVMSPFEVASGCDVVAMGQQYPNLVMSGGIDKRVLAKGRAAIDAHLDYILPAMHRRGGYIPTCDHGVPEEVPYSDYLHYRKRLLEYA